MKKHTKGPWTVQPSDEDEWEYDVKSGPYYVATCHDAANGGDTMMNAYLIAAAPELLKVLEWVADDFEMFGNGGVSNGTVEMVQAIIKKAKNS